jgi:hypothetical protein
MHIKFLSENPKGKDHVGHFKSDRRIIMKYILEKEGL